MASGICNNPVTAICIYAIMLITFISQLCIIFYGYLGYIDYSDHVCTVAEMSNAECCLFTASFMNLNITGTACPNCSASIDCYVKYNAISNTYSNLELSRPRQSIYLIVIIPCLITAIISCLAIVCGQFGYGPFGHKLILK